MNTGKTNGLVKQATFLMVAQMISSIIGLLYRSPLHMIMGDIGDGYYQYAYEWYSVMLLVASYSIPSAVSKVMAERLSKKEYRNANRVFHGALIYVCIVGGIISSVAYFEAPFLLKSQPSAILALQVLAPTIFFSGILGVMRGFFQAHNTMIPTAVSQIAEQIINAIFSVGFAYILVKSFWGIPDLRGKYGAAGGTLGTGAGVFTGLIFVLIIYNINKKDRKRRILQDTQKHTENYSHIFKNIFLMVTPIILSTCVYNISSIIDQQLFVHLQLRSGMGQEEISSLYGMFGYRFKPIINIPIALASATSTALIPIVASSFAAGKKGTAFEQINKCYKLTFFISVPSAVGLCILSYPIIYTLYPSGNVTGTTWLLIFGSVSTIFYSLSTVSNGALQGGGHASIPVKNAAFGLIINITSLLICNGIFHLNIYGLLVSVIAYSSSVMILNFISLRKNMNYPIQFYDIFSVCMKASAIMGVIVASVYWIPHILLPKTAHPYFINLGLLCISVIIGFIAYLFIYDRMKGLSEEEMGSLPMGKLFFKFIHALPF